jgi:hypothetical protein
VEVCRSCPTEAEDGTYNVSWSPSYNYGKIFPLLHKYPWEESDIGRNTYDPQPPTYHQDPWNIPILIRHLQNARLDESTQVGGKESRRARGKKRKLAQKKLVIVGDIASNYFTELPLEILEYVLTYTPTEGVKSLAQTCKGLKMIIPSGLGQLFWASRFQVPSFERGFAFEALTHGHGLNLKSLYFKMKYVTRGLRNRQRIWGLLQSISEVLSLQWNDSHPLLPLDKNENELRWKEVHGALHQPKEHKKSAFCLRQGCIRLYSQRSSIPTLLRQIVVFTISLGNTTYITGLRFIYNRGSEVCFGYRKGRESTLELTGIHGLIVAVGLRGIHALQFISPTGQLSQWFGDPNGVPKTRRLAIYRPVVALEAGFDVRFTPFHITYLLIKAY